MRIAIAGGTGRIGRLTSAALERAGHQAVPLSRRAGADAYTGAGLADAVRGCDAVIDVIQRVAGHGGDHRLLRDHDTEPAHRRRTGRPLANIQISYALVTDVCAYRLCVRSGCCEY